MDNGEGRFEPYPDIDAAEMAKRHNPKAGGIFKVGEKLTIKGSIFEVVEIRPNGMNLKLLKRGL